MEDNLQNFEQEPVIIREKKNSSKSLWYIIIALLILGVIGWFGYSAGWFSPRTEIPVVQPTVVPDLNVGLGNVPANAAPIDSVIIETNETFPVGQTVVVSGTLANGCTFINTPSQLRDGNVFYITLDTRIEGDICTEALVPYEERIDLQVNNLPAGVYIVNVNGRELSFELENDNALNFDAGEGK